MVLTIYFLQIYQFRKKIFQITKLQLNETYQLLPKNYTNTDNISLQLSNQTPYYLIQPLGTGKYSSAFLAMDIRTNKEVVVKIIKPVKMNKITREIKILQCLLGSPFTLQLLDITSVEDSQYPALIVNYAGESLHTQLSNISKHEFKLYIGQLLLALHYMHIHSIIHRDVKPMNCCIQGDKLTLIDFNLGSFYTNEPLHYRVATRAWKAPELLIGYENYDFAIDIYAVGVTVLSYINNKQLFTAQTNDGVLEKITEFFGSNELAILLKQTNIKLDSQKYQRLQGYKGLSTENKYKNCEPLDIEFLDCCLQLLPQKRMQAQELIQSRWFDEVREQLTEMYIKEFEYIVQINQKQIVLQNNIKPSYEQIKTYIIPVSPNFVAKQQTTITDEYWNEQWKIFQEQLRQE